MPPSKQSVAATVGPWSIQIAVRTIAGQAGLPGWLIRSMSRKGCSPDNAACEGFSGRLKTELFYPRDWQAGSTDQFIEAVDSYIRWYRIKISLGALSPVE